MAVDPGFAEYVAEQLGRVAPDVRSRRLFGGVSYSTLEGTFALLADGIVYLKGDKSNRERFIESGWPPFQPFGDQGSSMNYFAVPGELLEDVEALRPWVDLAREAAGRVARRRR